MKSQFVAVILLLPAVLFSQSDTLYKRRINLSVGVELLMPQSRGESFYSDKSYPNSIQASPTKPVISSTVNRNAYSFGFNFEARVFLPKLYFQTGLRYSRYEEDEDVYRDSLFKINGVWGNRYKWITLSNVISVPLGFSYRFNQTVFLSAGFIPSLISFNYQSESGYNGNTQLTPFQKDGGKDNGGPLVRYLTAQAKIASRCYLNAGITNSSWKKDDIYYSVGMRFFIL